MTGSTTKLNRLTRSAAAALCLCAAVIIGFSCVVLSFTVWKPSGPVEPEPFYTVLPGVNMERLPPAQTDAVLKKLNIQRCQCGCMRTMASCRNHHDSCTESLAISKDMVAAATPR